MRGAVNDSTGLVPSPAASDSEEVQSALETAGSLWAAGQTREALRFISRAAQSAAEAEDDLRSLELARAAADLKTRFGIESVAPQDGRASVPPPNGAPPGASVASASVPSPNTLPAGTPPSRTATQAQSGAAPAVTQSGAAPVTQAGAPGANVAARAPAPSAPGVRTPIPQPPATVTPLPPAPAPAPAPARPSSVPSAAEASGAAVVRHTAIRVQVTGRNADGSFSVRPLADGELAAPDARVALLVSIRPDRDPLPLD